MPKEGDTSFLLQILTQEEQKVFLAHKGHEQYIYRNVYQCPSGLDDFKVLRQFLSNIDEGKNFRLSHDLFGYYMCIIVLCF